MATLGATIALGLCALLLASCGSGSTASSAGGGDQPDDEAALEFAQCMREHGVDVPDPQPGEGPITFGSTRGPGEGKGPTTESAGPLSDPQGREAFEACQDKLGDAAPDISEEERQEMQDAALRFAQCMREHGVDMPDPQFQDGPGGGILMRLDAGNVDTDSPVFQQAQEACQDELPKPPGGVPRAPVGPSG
jgi:hypothetical protein